MTTTARRLLTELSRSTSERNGGPTILELADLDERELQPIVTEFGTGRGNLVVRYLEGVITNAGEVDGPLDAWAQLLDDTLTIMNVAELPSELTDLADLAKEMIRRCPDGYSGLLAWYEPSPVDSWDAQHEFSLDSPETMETNQLWDWSRTLLAEALLLHDAPQALVNGEHVPMFSSVVRAIAPGHIPGDDDVPVMTEWSRIRDQILG